MTDFIYNAQGRAVGFLRNHFIYTLSGQAVGKVSGAHVYKMNGSYVGELDRHMVVDKHLGTLASVGASINPGNPGSPGAPTGRAAQNFGYRDVFASLLS